MSRWFEHPTTSQTLEGDQVLNVLSFINEAKASFKTLYVDPNSNISPLDKILKLWPEKSSIKKEWLRRVLDNGPMVDKIESMGTVIAEFPMYSLYYLDHLISLVNLNKKRFAIISSDLLAKIFTNFLLPKMRPLINLNDRPLNTLNEIKTNGEPKKDKNGIPVRDKILSIWYFEEQLKSRYIRFLKALEDLAKNETDPINKIKMINLLCKSCTLKENQSLILDMLVNKLGDKNKKVAGSAFSKLSDIAHLHHILMAKIVRAVRKFIFRPNLSKRPQYYAVQLLARCKINKHNMVAEPNENDADDVSGIVTDNVAIELVQIYIGVFKRMMDSSKSKCEKLYSAIMTGLSRALQFTDGIDIQKHINTVFKLVHSSNLNLSTQCLKVLYVIVFPKKKTTTRTPMEPDVDQNIDHFLRLVYGTILNPSIFFNSQKVSMIDIFFKSIANDSDSTRAKAMIKRMLQMCLHHPEPGFICVCLLFLSRLVNGKHKSIFIRNSSVSTTELKLPVISLSNNGNAVVESDSEEEVVEDIVSDNEGNVKEEAGNEKRGKKEAGRKVAKKEEVEKEKPGKKVAKREEVEKEEAEKEESKKEESKKEESKKEEAEKEEAEKEEAEKEEAEKEKAEATTSWIHYNNTKSSKEPVIHYDPFARNPKYAHVDKEGLVELDLLRNHFHPSVKIFVEKIQNMEKIVYKTDPSEDMSLSKFLDRFAYKNPKKVEDKRKYLQKPTTSCTDEVRQIPVNGKEFVNLSENKVPQDELFFHKYFNHARQNNLSKHSEEIDSEFSDSDTEFDKYLTRDNGVDNDYNMSGSEMGDLGEEDEDLEFSDFSDDDIDDEEEMDDNCMSVDEEVVEGQPDDDEEADEQDSDDSAEDTETIHSSKRKRLGPELSNITTGALSLGKTFENIKDKAANQIRTDRKKRKDQKNKSTNRNFSPKMQSGKRKFKK